MRPPTSPALLWAHRIEEPIGRWTHLEEDGKGLHVIGNLNLKTENGREAFEHIRAGDAAGLSIGYIVPDGGRTYRGKGVFEISDLDLVEVSVVAVPANPKARITGVKQLESKADAIVFLREAGLSKAAAQRFAASGFQALTNASVDHDRAMKLAAELDRATTRLGNRA